MKLEELCDTVVHVAPPYDRFHDTSEAVVKQNDVSGFLGNVRTAYSLQNTDRRRDFDLIEINDGEIVLT